MTLCIRGKIVPQEKNPINRFLIWAYHPFARFVLKHRVATLVAAALVLASTVPVVVRLGSELMSPLCEGTILYMPITLPEVDPVFGKAGRAITATDPAELASLRRRYDRLTARERDVMGGVVAGLLNKQIAAELGTKEATVKEQRSHVMLKMQASSVADLVRMATRLSLHAPQRGG